MQDSLDKTAIDAIIHLVAPNGRAPTDTGSLLSQIYDLALDAKVRRDHPGAMPLGKFLMQAYPDVDFRSFPGGGKIEDIGDGHYKISASNASNIYHSRAEAERELWKFLVQAGMI